MFLAVIFRQTEARNWNNCVRLLCDAYLLRRHTEAGQDFKVVLPETGPELEEEREAWRACAMDFLSLAKQAGEPQPKSFRKKERLASRDWLLRTDKQLTATLDKGLAFWCRELPGDEKREHARCTFS